MDDRNLVLHEVKVIIEAFAIEIGLVRVPTDTHVLVSSHVEDGLDVWQQRGATAVNLQPDRHPMTVAKLTEFTEGFTDLLQRLLFRYFFGQAVRPDLHATGADVMRKHHVFFRG